MHRVTDCHEQRQCMYYFPEAFPIGTLPNPNVNKTNAAYTGWNVHVDRLFFANGLRTSLIVQAFRSLTSHLGDPWRGTTVSADGTHFKSTPEQPIAMGNGFHASDLVTRNGDEDPTIKAVQEHVLRSMHIWLQGFEPVKRDVTFRRATKVEYERGIV